MHASKHTWWRQVAVGVYYWLLWGLITMLVGSQFLGVVWNSSSSDTDFFYGQDPRNPPGPLGGFNDEWYSDRAIICMAEGRAYAPMQLSVALSDPRLARPTNDSGVSVNGIRVVKRDVMKLSAEVAADYGHICDRLDATLTAIQSSCEAMGFNVTRDFLRVVEGVASDTTVVIPRALPIMINPFWDNAVYMHYVIPSEDGAACVFQLQGSYNSDSSKTDVLRGARRSVRTSNVETWLRKPGGKWRNGWYEDPSGGRWAANMQSAQPGNVYGIVASVFDLTSNSEIDCAIVSPSPLCLPSKNVQNWGPQFMMTAENFNENQAFVSNGTRFGQFMFSTTTRITVTISYSLENFISNVSVFGILFRWFVSMATMLRSYRHGVAPLQTTGIGCLSSSRTFNVLPIVLLPRLRNTLVAFFTVGCYFEGEQAAVSEAWFAMYPCIVELMFYFYSLINIACRITYRRTSDVLFGPTLLFLCALHYARYNVSDSSFFNANGRMSTLLLSDEVAALRVTDFFSSDVALRLNGNVVRLFILKLVVLALNLLPLLFSEKMTETSPRWNGFSTCQIEKTLAIRASNVGGLGRSIVYVDLAAVNCENHKAGASTQPTLVMVQASKSAVSVVPQADKMQTNSASRCHVLTSYELNRLGYLIYGGKYLLSYDDWYILTSMAPFRAVEKLWNYRISVYEVTRSASGAYTICERPRVCRLDDPDLRAIPFSDITLSVFR